MNWRISRAVAALFIFSFLVSSCEDPTAIGLELQGPGTQIGTSFTDTTTVLASTVLLKDEIIALGAGRVQVGQVKDATFGVATAETYAEFGLVSNNVEFDPNTGADSLVLTLDYDFILGDGDTTQATTWNVYRLREGFTDLKTYYTTTSMAHDNEPIGSVTFTPRPKSTYYTVGTAGDTTKNLPFLIRIRLDKTTGGLALANEILAQSDKAPLKTQQAFVTNLLQGLVIAPAAQPVGNVILGLNLTSNNSKLVLHYTSTTDSKPKNYAFYPTKRYFNRLTADFSGTVLASLDQNGDVLPASAAGGRTFLRSGVGLVTKLTLPYLLNLRKVPAGEPGAGQTRDLAINKAELVIPIDASNLEDTLFLPPVISVVEATLNNLIARTNNLPNALSQEGGGQYATLEYRGTGKGFVYVVNITTYVQNLLYNNRPNHGLILFPSDLSSNLSTPLRNAQTLNRAVLRAVSQTDPSKELELRVFYSVAK